MRIFNIILLFIILGIVIPAYGQIVIDWTEIPHVIGTEWIKNTEDSVTVELGSPGGPQLWDFTSQPMGQDTADYRIVQKETTPFSDSFPNANLAYEKTSNSDYDTMFIYSEIASNLLRTFGSGVVSPDTFFLFKYDPLDSLTLPLSYGDTSHYHYGYPVDLGLGPVYDCRFDIYGYRIIDAYGTIIIPYGTFECLRICKYDTCLFTIDSSGVTVYQ